MFIALKEVYYGKTPKLLEAEKKMESIKKDYDGEYYNTARVMADKRWNEICKLLTDEFGFKDLYIELQAEKMVNACTPPISVGIDCIPQYRVKKNFMIDRKGMKFKPEAGYVCVIMAFSGLILNPNFTASEVIAILLHEIGHNFQSVIDDTCYFLSDVVYVGNIINDIIWGLNNGDMKVVIDSITIPFLYSNPVKQFIINLDKTMYANEFLTMVDTIYGNIAGRFKQVKHNLYFVATVVLRLANLPGNILRDIIRGINRNIYNPLGYRKEVIADNFVTMYGYSVELSSALQKAEINRLNDIEVVKVFDKIGLGMIPRTLYSAVTLSASMMDVHPNTIVREMDQVKYLKEELKRSDLSKPCKDEIMKQVNEIESNMEALMKDPQLDKHWDIYSYCYAALLYGSDGGIRPKMPMNKGVHASIQKTYDRAIKSLK